MIRRHIVEEDEVIGLKGLFPIGMSVKGKLKKTIRQFYEFCRIEKNGNIEGQA